MELHLLLTPELKKTIPKTTKFKCNYGDIVVVFGESTLVHGDNCIIIDDKQNIIDWLSPLGDIPVGSGVPQSESFEYLRIKSDLK